MSKAESKLTDKRAEGGQEVNDYIAQLEHPLKAEVVALRKIILGANKGITEQIKWNAPSFSYKGYLVTFNLYSKQQLRLIFHNGIILEDKSGLLQGDYVDRRIAYFSDMREVKARTATLQKLVRKWVRLMDGKSSEKPKG